MSALKRLGMRVREIAREEARAASPPVRRFKVTRVDPLTVEDVSGDRVLEEGDEDVEIDRSLLDERPDKGDVVRVHQDRDGDYLITGVID